MASYATIYFNYNQAIAQANVLSEQASNLRKIANNDLESTINQIAQQWEGQCATLYLSKCRALKADLLESAKELDKTAESIKRAAKRMREADLEAKRLAETVSGTGGAFGGGSGGGGGGGGGGGY